MAGPFIGREALDAGRLTRDRLRTHFEAVFPGVYVPAGVDLSAVARAQAAYLWTGREGVVAGRSAAAVHGARWVDANRPPGVLLDNRRAPLGLRVWSDRVADDEIVTIRGMRV